MNQISYYDPSHYIGAQSDLTQMITLRKNVKLSLWAKTDKDSFKVELWTVTDSFAEQCM